MIGWIYEIRRHGSEIDEIKRWRSLRKGTISKTFIPKFFNTAQTVFSNRIILTNSIVQVLLVGLIYLVWIQIFAWIPEHVYRNSYYTDQRYFAHTVLLIWSIACVGIASFVVALLSAGTIVTYIQIQSGSHINFCGCLRAALPNLWFLWVYQWIDGWLTVRQIVLRLPTSNPKYKRTIAEAITSEALYYGWKVGTMGLVPSILYARSDPLDTINLCVAFTKSRILDLIRLRLGYSGACWIVGCASYILTLTYLQIWWPLRQSDPFTVIYEVYRVFSIPIIVALVVVNVILRPVYLLSVVEMFHVYATDHDLKFSLTDETRPASTSLAIIIFCMLVVIIFVVLFFHNQLGITAALHL